MTKTALVYKVDSAGHQLGDRLEKGIYTALVQ